MSVKTAGAESRQSYHLHVPIVMKSGSLNLLEPSGPVQAFKGIALPWPDYKVGRVTSVVIATDRGSNPNGATSRPGHVKWVPVISPEGSATGGGVDHPPTSNAEGKQDLGLRGLF